MTESTESSEASPASPVSAPGLARDPWERPLSEITSADLLGAIRRGWALDFVIPRALDLIDAGALTMADECSEGLLRTLVDVDGAFWTRHPRLYARYRGALRAGALARRALPPNRRLDFWLARTDE